MKVKLEIVEEWVGRNANEVPDERELKTILSESLIIDGRTARKVLREAMEQYPPSFGYVHHGAIRHNGKTLFAYQDE